MKWNKQIIKIKIKIRIRINLARHPKQNDEMMSHRLSVRKDFHFILKETFFEIGSDRTFDIEKSLCRVGPIWFGKLVSTFANLKLSVWRLFVLFRKFDSLSLKIIFSLCFVLQIWNAYLPSHAKNTFGRIQWRFGVNVILEPWLLALTTFHLKWEIAWR